MELIENIAKNDYLGFYADGTLNYQKVPEFLRIEKKQLSQIAGISRASVRFDNRIPNELAERLEEIANIANRVAALFEGDIEKAALWFRTSNPLLGEVSPRDMLRMGRYARLAKFVGEAEQTR